MFRVEVRGVNANDEPISAHPGQDNELWLGDFPTSASQSYTSGTGEYSDLGDDGYEASDRSNVFDQVETTQLQNRAAAPEIPEQIEQPSQTGPFTASSDQALGLPAAQPHGGAMVAETVAVTDIVANALEGRTVDLDALLGSSEPIQPQFVLQTGNMDQFLGGDGGMSSTAGLFTIDLSQQQAMAQLEHAAATGHV
jgi:hypothetical protein